MSLKHGILGLLTFKPMSGYDVMKVFEKSLAFFWSAQTSQIYRDLDSLVAAGLAELHEEVQRGRQLKAVYSITAAGKTELQKWLNDGTGETGGFKSAFLLKLFFQSHAGLPSLKILIENKKIQAEKNVAQLTAVLAEIEQRQEPTNELTGLCWSMTAEYGVMQYEMEARWAKQALAHIDAFEGKKA